MTIFHVATTGSDSAAGSQEAPFRTIQRAAEEAQPGDTVMVHEGEYREWVKPRRGGLSNTRRITYQAAEGEQVVIKGSEKVTDWTQTEGSVWKAVVPNSLFGDYNPFAIKLEGDWVVRETEDEPRMHLGDVYLNGMSFYEVLSKDALANPTRREMVVDNRTGREVPVVNPDSTVYVWYAEVGEDETTIWANFQDADPNAELVEINARRSVFYPEANHLDWITVRGFELAQAATPWAPPTADQPGLIGPNWAKGWIIEDCHIHDAKCSAVSLGKEASTGHNFFTLRHDKPGYQYQLESVFTARQIGWSKESIGSHIVRNNVIHDCGQNGIVGHLGCVFSEIYGNHIYNVAVKREFYGHEIGGIKLHAAIDVQIHDNYFHHTALGIWSDWQTQGTRISRNVFHDNGRDLYVEVSHGPYVVDYNLFGSDASIENMCDGGAWVGNLFAGTYLLQPVMERATPYHYPHSTKVAGYAVIYAGDDRMISNIFVGNGGDPADASAIHKHGVQDITRVGYGTLVYDEYPASWEEYMEQVMAGLPGDLGVYLTVKNAVYIRDNAYLDGARAYAKETDAVTDAADPELKFESTDDGVYFEITLPDSVADKQIPVVAASDLHRVRMVDLDFEEPDGSPVEFRTDLVGNELDGDVIAGPITSLTAGHNRVKVWG